MRNAQIESSLDTRVDYTLSQSKQQLKLWCRTCSTSYHGRDLYIKQHCKSAHGLGESHMMQMAQTSVLQLSIFPEYLSNVKQSMSHTKEEHWHSIQCKVTRLTSETFLAQMYAISYLNSPHHQNHLDENGIQLCSLARCHSSWHRPSIWPSSLPVVVGTRSD